MRSAATFRAISIRAAGSSPALFRRSELTSITLAASSDSSIGRSLSGEFRLDAEPVFIFEKLTTSAGLPRGIFADVKQGPPEITGLMVDESHWVTIAIGTSVQGPTDWGWIWPMDSTNELFVPLYLPLDLSTVSLANVWRLGQPAISNAFCSTLDKSECLGNESTLSDIEKIWELGQDQHSSYQNTCEWITDIRKSFSLSSWVCMRLQCWRKLSGRGHILSFLEQFFALQR